MVTRFMAILAVLAGCAQTSGGHDLSTYESNEEYFEE